MRQFRAVLEKEWLDMVRNKLVFSVVIFIPLMTVSVPIIMLFVMSRIPAEQQNIREMERLLENPMFAGLQSMEALQAVMATNMMVLFLMMPLMVPVTIASYSIVGEKASRSLEPLLAAPISTTRLLVSKSVAAALPGVVMTWLAYIVFLIVARLIPVSDRVFAVLVNPMWLVAMFLLAPLLTIMAVSFGIIISSRVNDPRAAEQLCSLIVLPLMLFFVGATAGIVMLSSGTFLIAAAVIAAIDVMLVYMGTLLFQREKILTEWK